MMRYAAGVQIDEIPNCCSSSDGVCGGSRGFGAGKPCSGQLSWTDARDYCEGVGARLCTESELRNNVLTPLEERFRKS